MIVRNLKALGVALAVAFSFAATATAAMAEEHHFHGTPGVLPVIANNVQQFTFTTGSGQGFTCETVGVEASLEAETSTLSRITKIPHLRSRDFPTPCDTLP